jgi:chromosome segregation ATPase
MIIEFCDKTELELKDFQKRCSLASQRLGRFTRSMEAALAGRAGQSATAKRLQEQLDAAVRADDSGAVEKAMAAIRQAKGEQAVREAPILSEYDELLRDQQHLQKESARLLASLTEYQTRIDKFQEVAVAAWAAHDAAAKGIGGLIYNTNLRQLKGLQK